MIGSLFAETKRKSIPELLKLYYEYYENRNIENPRFEVKIAKALLIEQGFDVENMHEEDWDYLKKDKPQFFV